MAENKDRKSKNVDVKPKTCRSRSVDRRDGYVWSGQKFSWSHRTESYPGAEAGSATEKGAEIGQITERMCSCSSLNFDLDRSCGCRVLGRSLKQKLQDAMGQCFPIKACSNRHSSMLVSKRKICIGELMLDNCPFPPKSDLAFKWHLIKQHTAPVNPKLEEDLLSDLESEGEEKAGQFQKRCKEDTAGCLCFGHSHPHEKANKHSTHKLNPKEESFTINVLNKNREESHIDSANEAVTLCTNSRKRNKPKWELDEESFQAGTPPKYHTQVDFVHCLVPDLFRINNNPCYWGVMDRYAAEALLDGKPEGTFLLRDSAQDDYLFSVSFRRYSRSLHARIEQWNHNFSFDAHDPCVFHAPDISGLLEHYKDPSACMFFEPLLSIPLSRTFPFSLQHLSRTVICNSTTYDGIESLPVPPSMKLYLKEYHYKSKVRVRRIDVPKQEDEK